MAKTIWHLVQELTTHGGAIVLSSEASHMEIAHAQAEGRWVVDDNGLGFIRRTREWLDGAHNAIAAAA